MTVSQRNKKILTTELYTHILCAERKQYYYSLSNTDFDYIWTTMGNSSYLQSALECRIC